MRHILNEKKNSGRSGHFSIHFPLHSIFQRPCLVVLWTPTKFIVMSLQNFWLKCIGYAWLMTHDSRCIADKHSSLVMHSTQCSPRASHSGLHWVECITCDSCIVYNASLVIRHLSCIIQYIFAKNSAIAHYYILIGISLKSLPSM